MLQASAVEWVDASVTQTCRSEGEDLLARKHIMILAERDGDRRLPVRIRPDAATALALALEPAEPPRPFACKLAASVDAVGSAVFEVITSLIAQVFYAAVTVRGPGSTREADSRSNGAVNLALVAGSPIRINSKLFNLATPEECASELVSSPVVTAQIEAEVQQRFRERHGATPSMP